MVMSHEILVGLCDPAWQVRMRHAAFYKVCPWRRTLVGHPDLHRIVRCNSAWLSTNHSMHAQDCSAFASRRCTCVFSTCTAHMCNIHGWISHAEHQLKNLRQVSFRACQCRPMLAFGYWIVRSQILAHDLINHGDRGGHGMDEKHASYFFFRFWFLRLVLQLLEELSKCRPAQYKIVVA